MAGGIIPSTIQEGATPYFKVETLNRWRNASLRYLPLITGWIQLANLVINRSLQLKNYKQSLFTKVFKNSDTDRVRSGVGFFGKTGGVNSSVSLYTQWQSVVLHSSRQEAKNEIDGLINDSILTRGYYILTRLGEEIRGDGEVHYKIVAHTGVSNSGYWSKAVEYNLDLKLFLNFGTKSNKVGFLNADYFDLKISGTQRLAEKMGQAGIKSREWTQQELWEYNQFVHLVSRIVTLRGKKKSFEEAGKLSVNSGLMLEAFLLLGYHYKYRIKGNKAQWKELRALAHRLMAFVGPLNKNDDMENAMLKTLEDPAPFWLGGEGGRLANMLVKGNGASVTNILTLVRQMTRAYSILVQLPSKISSQVETKTLDASLKFSDDEAMEAVVEMFYREGWKEKMSITWTL